MSKWQGEVKGEKEWEKQLGGITCNFIPVKEILSNAYNLDAALEKSNVRYDDTYLDIINSAKVDVFRGEKYA